MAEKGSREWVIDFIKQNLAPGIREEILGSAEYHKKEMLIKEFEKMGQAFVNAPRETLIEYASLVLPLSQLVTIYFKTMDDLALKLTALETYFGVNGIDIKELEKQKKRQGFTLINCANT